MHVFFRVVNDVALVRIKLLVAFHRAVVHLSVHPGVSVVQTAQGLEERRAPTARSADDQHHLARFDDARKVFEQVSLPGTQTRLALFRLAVAWHETHVVSSSTVGSSSALFLRGHPRLRQTLLLLGIFDVGPWRDDAADGRSVDHIVRTASTANGEVIVSEGQRTMSWQAAVFQALLVFLEARQ